MRNFIQKNFTIIVCILLIISFLKGCNDSKKIAEINKKLIEIQDSTFSEKELSILLEINGLQTEHRFIQSTNRTIFDVKRQNQIESEIQILKTKLTNR